MIEAFFTLTEAEYVECQRLYLRGRTKRPTRWMIALSAVFCVSVFAIVRVRQSARDTLIFVLVCAIGGGALGFVIGELRRTRNLRQRFQTGTRMFTDAHLRLDDGGIQSKVEGIGESKLEWNACTKWLESKNVFILLYGNSLIPIPKRTLSDDYQSELRNLLTRKVAPSGVQREL